MTIALSNLKVSFGKTNALAIDELTISSGSTTALVGPNGAGKSTLLLVLAGLLRPTSGRAKIAGELSGSIELRRMVSFVPDQPALFDDLTLDDQLHYVARLHDNREPSPECLGLIEVLDAQELLTKFPRSMSKGQRQKAALLVGTARPFEVLLLDEPTTGLDADSRAALIAALAEFAQAGSTIICSTHDRELIDASDEVVRLVKGVIVDDAPADADWESD